MSKILIIEDNTSKLEKLRRFVGSEFVAAEITEKGSYNAAQQEVFYHGKEYDVILLDVSMYTYDANEDNSGEPEPLAGSNILRLMKLRQVKTPVIVVTMYESFVDGVRIQQLDEKFKEQYQDIYKGFVYYSIKNEDWQDELSAKMEAIL